MAAKHAARITSQDPSTPRHTTRTETSRPRHAAKPPVEGRDAYADQPMRERNIQALVSFFEAGGKVKPGKLGVELEHILVDGTGEPISYSQPNGVADVLRTLSKSYPRITMHGDDIMGVSRPFMNVTIEPAAQLELSAGPFSALADVEEAFTTFEKDVAHALAPIAGKALTIGYDPVLVAKDKELIPKARYEYMNAYLSAISPYGPRMMRGSASTQVSIDYRDEDDFRRKFRIASILAPLFALMMDNAPVFEGEPSPHPMMRTEIWRYLDPDRSNTVPGALDADFGFADYAAYILDTPAIVALDDATEFRYDTRTFGDIYATTPMQTQDVVHAISMVFPDVRLKQYVEIRPADSVPVPYVTAYAGLIKGLFYDPEVLDELDRATAGITERDIDDAKTSLMQAGYQGVAYGRDAASWCDLLIELARRGLKAERAFLDPLAKLVAERVRLAETY